MEFNKENYEEYALDFLEGNLSSEDRLQFESFLWRNPDIKTEFDDFQLIYLPEPNSAEKFPNKERLIKPVAVTIPLHNRNKNITWKKWSVAASILLLLGVTYFATINQENVPDTLVEVQPTPTDKETLIEKNKIDESPLVVEESLSAVLEKEKKTELDNKEKDLQNTAEESAFDINKTVASDLVVREAVQAIEEKVFSINSNEELDINIFGDLTPIRDVVQVPTLPQRFVTPGALEIEDRELTMPILIIEEESDEKFRLGKFLAKANLLPRSFGDIVGVGFKEKLVPESFQEIKETR